MVRHAAPATFLPFLLLRFVFACAHPGGFTEGRGSCGSEYASVDNAFDVVDVTEAWYVRRMATCDNPFAWTTFTTTQADQRVYIAANLPDIDRFHDRLQYNGVIFGPGLTKGPGGPDAVVLPPGAEIPFAYQETADAAPVSLQPRGTAPPASYANCDFVANEVMDQYDDVHDGRCMESMTLPVSYKNPLIAGLLYRSEWLYSVDHTLPTPGRYFLLSWLTERTTGKVATGKYDLTLGPWTWSRYADQNTTSRVQSQGSTCQCAFNALEWREASLADRLSGLPAAALAQALPAETCGDARVSTQEVCASATGKDPLAIDTEIEWSGQYALLPGSTYEWRFHTQTGQTGATTYATQYPDEAIVALLAPQAAYEAVAQATDKTVEQAADAAMKASENTTVTPGGQMAHAAAGGDALTSLPTRSSLKFNKAVNSSITTVFRIVLPANAPAGPYRMFTQHVPHEFSASFLTCAAGACAADGLSPYVYPSDTSLYLGASTYTKRWTVDAKISKGEQIWTYNGGSKGANAATKTRVAYLGAFVAAVSAVALLF